MDQAQPGYYLLFSVWKAGLDYAARPKDERAQGAAEFLAAIGEFAGDVTVRAYSTLGLRHDADFILWLTAGSLDSVQRLMERLRQSRLGADLENTHAYLAVSRESVRGKGHPETEAQAPVEPGTTDYLFLHPLVRSAEWYLLPIEERRRLMLEHSRAGHRFRSIATTTAYSLGDQDFVMAYEGDDPRQLVALHMAFRETEMSRYTVRDTPRFTGRRRPLEQILESLG